MLQPIIFKLQRLRVLGKGVSPLRGLALLPAQPFRIFGITKDLNGTALSSCTVHLFRTVDDLEIDIVTSDANGNYEFRSASAAYSYYAVAYKAGGTDVFGTTINTLIGTA